MTSVDPGDPGKLYLVPFGPWAISWDRLASRKGKERVRDDRYYGRYGLRKRDLFCPYAAAAHPGGHIPLTFWPWLGPAPRWPSTRAYPGRRLCA